MNETFILDGKLWKVCGACQEDRPLATFVVDEGENLSDVCCFCETHENTHRGLDFEARPYGDRLATGFASMGDE